MSLSVLVIEDEVMLADLLRELFVKAGHRVKTVHTITEAEKVFFASVFDVVLCDICLPDGKGDQLIKKLLAVNTDSHVQFNLMSGYFPDDIDTSVTSKVANFIQKPKDLFNVVSIIEGSCEQILSAPMEHLFG